LPSRFKVKIVLGCVKSKIGRKALTKTVKRNVKPKRAESLRPVHKRGRVGKVRKRR